MPCMPDVFAIARLTSLTRLELIEYYCNVSQFTLLQNLGLIELVLMDCPYIPENIIRPGGQGALTALQKPYVADQEIIPSLEDFNRALETPGSEFHLTAHGLCHQGAIAMSLPNLVELSGQCSLFTVGMADCLSARGWHRSPSYCQCMTNFDWHPETDMWTKPD